MSALLKKVHIEDGADTNTRGFIEGYYGVPWSNEDRMSLMEFGGNYKMTSYVFAPKDDPYHKNLWREEYPAEELAGIQEMVNVGLASKCRFVWTAHPFMGGFNQGDYKNEIKRLLNKFEQLYSIGVRQFGVLGDDVGNLPRTIVIEMMQEVVAWGKEKGDVYPPVFCPGGYNHAWQGDYSELNEYDAGFPPEVQIFWTGEAVCQPVIQQTLDHFRNYNSQHHGQRRAPLFWLNWPVNDINMSRLMLGTGSMLHPDVNPEDLAGVVTNPMQDAQASKVALFAVADYTWNIKGFNNKQSWQDSFKFIDPDAGEELAIIARHMSDPSPNGHGLVLEESEDLKPLFESFMNNLEAGTLTAEECNNLIKEFEIIKKACVDFHKKSKNEDLKEELLPFTESLKDQSEAAILFIKTQMALEEGNAFDVWTNYSQATSIFEQSKKHDRPTISGTKPALPGSKRITPFINGLADKLSVPVNSLLDDSKLITNVITNRKDMPRNAADALLDNNPKTEVVLQNPSSSKTGDYIGVQYSKAVSVKDITFRMGRNGNLNDTFGSAKIEYTEDGKEWKELPGTAYTDGRHEISAKGLDLKVKGIRLIATADKGNMWLGCRDIVVNEDSYPKPEKPKNEKLSGTGIYSEDSMVIAGGSIQNMVDEDTGSKVTFKNGDHKDYTVQGAWVGIDFGKEVEVNQVVMEQKTADKIVKASVQYFDAASGQWKNIKTVSNLGSKLDVKFETVKTSKIRVVNEERTERWWDVHDLSAYLTDNGFVFNPIVTVGGNLNAIHQGSNDLVLDGDDNSFVWYKGPGDNTNVGDYIQLDLKQDVYLKDIHFAMAPSGGDLWDEYELSYSLNGKDFTPVKTFNTRTANIDLSSQNIKARYVRMTNKKQKNVWVKFAEFKVNATTTPYLGLEFIYTNMDLKPYKELSANVQKNTASINNVGTITLKPGDYIGLKLDRIKDITKVDVTTQEGLAVQTSRNAVEWTDASALEDARYIRVMNTTEAPITFDLTTFVVESFELEPIHVESTNFGDEGSHMKAFDQDWTTEAVLQGSQTAGKYITYDLGQTIDLHSLKLVLHDGTTDFPRHAKVSISEDNQEWKEIMIIGDQNADNKGEAAGTDHISELFPVHEISYYTNKVDGLNEKARYIKFELTRSKSGPDKWVRIREIELNDGKQYLPSENNPTITTTVEGNIESSGNTMMNMIDGNVSTTFTPKTKKAGSMTYHLSDQTDITKLTILQSADSPVSKVSAKVINQEGMTEEVELGNLSASMNEFDMTSFQNVLSVTIAWDAEKAPTIHEIMTLKTEVSKANKEKLNQKIVEAEKVDQTNLTPASKDALNKAISLAKEIQFNVYATQSMVDSCTAQLKKAMDALVVKPDLEAYKAQIQELTKDVLTKENYILRTWRVYEERFNEANEAMKDENISQKQLDACLEKLTAAVQQLVYEVSSIEKLQILVEDIAKVDMSAYDEVSVQGLNALVDNAKALIEADKQERQLPETVKAQIAELQDYLDNKLATKVLVEQARQESEQAKGIQKDAYSETSYNNVQNAAANLDNALATGNKTAIEEAQKALKDAMDALQPIEAVNGVQAEIDRLKATNKEAYTANSYNHLMEVIAGVEAKLATGNEYDAYLAELKDAENALVSVAALKAKVADVQAMDLSEMSEASVAEVQNAVENAKALYENGTNEEVAAAIERLDAAVQNLVLSSETIQKGLEEFKQALNGQYTQASKDALQKAIDEAEAKKDQFSKAEWQETKAQLQDLKDALIDTKDLEEAIKEAKKEDGKGYTSKSFEAYQTTIKQAEKLLVDGKETEIQDMIQTLKNKDAILVKVGNFDALKQLLNKIGNIKASDYTEESYKAFQAELKKAKAMVEKEDASQAEIDAQKAALELAYSKLVKKSDVAPVNPNTPQGGGSTGYMTNASQWMGLSVVSALLASALFFKKRKGTK